MKKIIIIPARGGSKGLPGKNIKPLLKKPLIHYTIEAAREIVDDNLICVSTDSLEIKKCVEDFGLHLPFLRPDFLSSDSSSSYDVLIHALDFYEKNNFNPEIIILLQPTSPLRKSIHIKEALKLYNSNIDMVVSVNKTKSNPYFVLFEENDEGFLERSKTSNFTTRQSCPSVWELNGAIYIINVKSLKFYKNLNFKKILKYEMPANCSVDIDTIDDFKLAEFYMNNYNNDTN